MKIVVVGCVALTLLSACSNDTEKSNDADAKKDTVIKTEVTSANAGDLTIGYYELERLATDFDFMREADEQLTAEGQSIQDELIYWQRELESNYTKLNEGMSKGILTSTEQQALGQKVERAQQNLSNIQQNKAMKFQEKQADFNMKLEAKVLAYSEDFAKENGLKVLFARGPGSGISYIDGAFDMTDEFIEYMNARQKELNGEDSAKTNNKK